MLKPALLSFVFSLKTREPERTDEDEHELTCISCEQATKTRCKIFVLFNLMSCAPAQRSISLTTHDGGTRAGITIGSVGGRVEGIVVVSVVTWVNLPPSSLGTFTRATLGTLRKTLRGFLRHRPALFLHVRKIRLDMFVVCHLGHFYFASLFMDICSFLEELHV